MDDKQQEFRKVISKYKLDEKADEIADYLTKHTPDTISVKDFAKFFAMEEKEAIIFLSFIEKGIKFKEQHIDNK